MTAAETRLWPALAFQDADRMIAWLRAVGFTEHATYRSEADPAVVEHAEWLWPPGGGVVFGSLRDGAAVTNVGGSAVYLVTDDVDGVYARAVAAGASVEREPAEQPYGGRGPRSGIRRATTGPSGATSRSSLARCGGEGGARGDPAGRG